MIRFGTPSDADLERLRAASVTYDHVGSTLTPVPPVSAVRIEASVRVGAGPDAMVTGRRALRDWVPQRALGMTVAPNDVRPDAGETVILGLGRGAARLRVPNRVVATIDEPDCYGYAYGTLPGHPERGEEVFLLELESSGDVVLTIRADSVPAGALRLVRPAVGLLQRAALRKYLVAVRDAVSTSEGTP